MDLPDNGMNYLVGLERTRSRGERFGMRSTCLGSWFERASQQSVVPVEDQIANILCERLNDAGPGGD